MNVMIEQDHPRRCGENVLFALVHRACNGSPPQVRGKHFIQGLLALIGGITPAGAGKTFSFVGDL